MRMKLSRGAINRLADIIEGAGVPLGAAYAAAAKPRVKKPKPAQRTVASLQDGEVPELRLGTRGCIAFQWNGWRTARLTVKRDAKGNVKSLSVVDGKGRCHKFTPKSTLPSGRAGSMVTFVNEEFVILQVRGVTSC